MDYCCREPPRSRFWWMYVLLFSAQRQLNNHVDPLCWDNGTTVTPTDQCTFVQLVIALLTVFCMAGRRAVGLFAVTRLPAVALHIKTFAFGHLVRIYGCPKPDRRYAVCVFVAQCAAILAAACLLATVYVPIVGATWSLLASIPFGWIATFRPT